ncbi:MAG: trypsin-like peptidase domain-containing protein, partial [Lewinellaceae bacterium]|nr:trypsin-like peptidase domain-containing protein [Lewinellaceae bacterium]
LIDAKDSNLGIEEAGSGLLVGYGHNRIYLATAYHVVAGMTHIDVRFQSDRTPYPATLVQHDRELDLAVLFISAVLDTNVLGTINIKMEEDFTKGEPVFSIGHPFGEAWQLNDRNILLEEQDNLDPRLATITPEAIVPGCSGGPVFDLKEELIGLILRENEINAPCVRAYTIKKKLKDWRIPSNLILTNEEWWNSLSSSWRFIFRRLVNIQKRRISAPTNVPPAEFFQKLFAITKFECNNCGLADLTPLSRLNKIQNLIARKNFISDLEPLAKLRRLKYLDLRKNEVRSLEPLAELYDLEKIDLKNNRPLHDLSPVSGLANLKQVNFTRASIRTIKPLYFLNDLTSVKIFLTDIPKAEINLLKKQLPEVKVGFRYKREGLSHLAYLVSNPARREKGALDNMENKEDHRTKPLITPVYSPATRYLSAQPAARENKQEPVVAPYETAPPNTTASLAKEPDGAVYDQRASETQTEEAGSIAYAEPKPQEKEPAKPQKEFPAKTLAAPERPDVREAAADGNRRQPEARQPAPPAEARPEKKPQPAAKAEAKPQQAQAITAADDGAPEPSPIVAHEEMLRELLLNRKPLETEGRAFNWLGEDPGNHLYRVYVVLGRIYQGKYEKARELWFFFQSKKLDNGENFTEKVIAEIDQLAEKGVTNSAVKKFRALISK